MKEQEGKSTPDGGQGSGISLGDPGEGRQLPWLLKSWSADCVTIEDMLTPAWVDVLQYYTGGSTIIALNSAGRLSECTPAGYLF